MTARSLLLALIWVGMTGVATIPNLLVGLVLGALVVMYLQRGSRPGPLGRLRRVAALLLYFVWELVLANLRLAMDVVTPRYYMRPAVFGVPLDARTDAEITLLANLISLTPGTLSLDVSEDRSTLYVHAMYARDRESFVRSIKSGFERRLLEVMR
jgi:multicomponent Na+:H+ antiporter subunit E